MYQSQKYIYQYVRKNISQISILRTNTYIKFLFKGELAQFGAFKQFVRINSYCENLIKF